MPNEITIPRLGWSMEEGVFVQWLKKDGDVVRQGDPLFELEGEKAVQEIEAVDAGILRIPANGPQPGSVIKVGTVVGHLVAAGEEMLNDQAPHPHAVDLVEIGSDANLPPAAAPSVRRLARELDVLLTDVKGTGRGGRILADDIQRVQVEAVPNAASSTVDSKQISSRESSLVASPRARRVAMESGIDWTRLVGSGANGRIREVDVRSAERNAAQMKEAVSSEHLGQRVPLSNRRRLIAQRLMASRQQTVPVTLTTRADATNLVNLRDQFKASRGSVPIPSYQDIITKLIASTLTQHPLLAGRWDEDAIVIPTQNQLHLGMAVDTDDGLLVPVIRDVANLSLMDLATKSRQLVEQARAGKLTAADMQGSVFTITNLGAFGIEAFTPIINVPEAAILGLGAIRREPVALDDGQIVSRQQITLSLTFDHRILDGAPAARFLQDVVLAITNPSALLLS